MASEYWILNRLAIAPVEQPAGFDSTTKLKIGLTPQLSQLSTPQLSAALAALDPAAL
jgi:hypothetical protein